MPVKDFVCERCVQPYQLKAQKSPFHSLVADAAYGNFLAAVNSGTAPNLVLLHYDLPRCRVINLDVIPRFFLNPSCVIPRKPLPPSARRAGWVGCDISLERLPPDARIEIVREENVVEQEKVYESFRRFASLLFDRGSEERGWTSDILRCVKALDKKSFSLHQVYEFEKELKKLHPENKWVRAKIRQQLQVLRDNKILKFVGPGKYELV